MTSREGFNRKLREKGPTIVEIIRTEAHVAYDGLVLPPEHLERVLLRLGGTGESAAIADAIDHVKSMLEAGHAVFEAGPDFAAAFGEGSPDGYTLRASSHDCGWPEGRMYVVQVRSGGLHGGDDRTMELELAEVFGCPRAIASVTLRSTVATDGDIAVFDPETITSALRRGGYTRFTVDEVTAMLGDRVEAQCPGAPISLDLGPTAPTSGLPLRATLSFEGCDLTLAGGGVALSGSDGRWQLGGPCTGKRLEDIRVPAPAFTIQFVRAGAPSQSVGRVAQETIADAANRLAAFLDAQT